jgi:demethylmenaquinone methyltransferase / 2-methoxy-6-polyprenyl-1,4-benzoquinol methylase
VAEGERQIPRRTRIIGRALNATVARAPWLWPVLRAPIQGYFDQLATGWDERTGAGSVDHLQALATATTRVSPAPERILDLGTGTGEGALFLAREFPRASVRGVDLSERMIHEAQSKVGLDPDGRVAFRVADAAALPYDDDSFDLVTLVNVPPFFGEIARVLRPGGHVVIVATGGAATPFYTPEPVLERGFRRRGVEVVERGEAGRGTWFIGRARRG